ncbi:MAG: SRPBCC family protein [Chitinophagaceae bacterium]
MNDKTIITVETDIKAPVEKVWRYWAEPKHIMAWNNASDHWHTPYTENNLRKGGKFLSRMEAKDGSSGFDFSGVYNEVKEHALIAYTIDDGRKVYITFSEQGNKTHISESFEAESTHPVDMQKSGWQAILNNFKKYTEAH